MWCDEALVFESTKVRYSAAVSEPRRRHRRYAPAAVCMLAAALCVA